MKKQTGNGRNVPWACGISGKYIDGGDLEETIQESWTIRINVRSAPGPMKIVMDA